MARIKFYNQETGQWEYADKAVSVGDNSGGNADYVGGEPADDDIPKVFLTGADFSKMTTAKNEVNMELEYFSRTEKFSAFIKIKFQGNSSLSYGKKNFTIKMYADSAYSSKLKKSFKDWGVEQNKYVLKANFIDHTHARNIVCANLWSDVIDSRSDYAALPEELRNSPRNGAIDGFPIKLYVNGTYQGIYTWNIGKDDWMWGMDEDNANHVLLCAETNAKTANPCNFNALWGGTDGTNWSVEVGTNSNAVKTALNNMIQFIMDNDGDAFKAGIGEYLDIQSAIDYYLHALVICGPDNIAKNMLIGTYDCKKWRLGVYDMDSVLGLWWTGQKFIEADYNIYNDPNPNAPDSLLWQRIEELYWDELKSRYRELRATVYSFGNMATHFERFMDTIGLDLYAEDLTIYSIPSGNTNNIQQIRNYIRDRLIYTDSLVFAITATSIVLSANTLTFNDENSQTLTATVHPENTSQPIVWTSSNNDVVTVENGVVTPISNGVAIITATCGNVSATCAVAVDGLVPPSWEIVKELATDEIHYGVGTQSASPYYKNTANRASHWEFDIPAESGYLYKLDYTSDISTARAAMEFYTQNVIICVDSALKYNTASTLDTGWIESGTEIELPDLVNDSPIVGVRIVFKQDDTSNAVTDGFITSAVLSRIKARK